MRSRESATNLATSVTSRLLRLARQNGDDYQVLLTRYCLERFLYRLGVSRLRPRFVLKGALLLGVWSDRPYRATFDLDMLRRGSRDRDVIRNDLQLIIATEVPPDAVLFDADRIRMEPFGAHGEYSGTRAILPASCGKARLTLQIDLGLGDAVWPAPGPCAFPTLLDFPAPDLLAYPREAVVAEKLEAIVVLGDRNSRIKDFFDIHYLSGHFAFERGTLTEAIRRTFTRRGTPIPNERPFGLTQEYWASPSRPAQARAFARRARLELSESFAAECTLTLEMFLGPLLDDLFNGRCSTGIWRPGGPWHLDSPAGHVAGEHPHGGGRDENPA